MKISYIDLNYEDHFESYSIKPTKYGGGRIFASWAKEALPDFHIFSNPKSFEDLQLNSFNERKNHCHPITNAQRMAIRDGAAIESVIDSEVIRNTDIFVHHFTNIHINTPKPQIVWSIGFKELINPKHTDVMLYDFKNQHPIVSNLEHKIHSISIGSLNNSFAKYPKENFIFQCTRHVREFGSIEVARFCRNNKITGVFAGPINEGYPLLAEIDGKYTHYLGVIEEQAKENLTKRARLYTFLHKWPTPFNLSAVEALGYGTPIVATKVGFWPDFIIEGKNGFLIDDESELLNAWEKSKNISQSDCYNSVVKYSLKNMIHSFREAIETCYKSNAKQIQ